MSSNKKDITNENKAHLQNSRENKFSNTENTNVGEVHAGGHKCSGGAFSYIQGL